MNIIKRRLRAYLLATARANCVVLELYPAGGSMTRIVPVDRAE